MNGVTVRWGFTVCVHIMNNVKLQCIVDKDV